MTTSHPAATVRSLPKPVGAAIAALAGMSLLVACGADERTADEGAAAPSGEERQAEEREVSGGFCAAVEDAQASLDEIDPSGAVRALRPWRTELPEEVADDLEAHLLDLELATNVPEPAGDDVASERAGQRFATYADERCNTTYEYGDVQAFE